MTIPTKMFALLVTQEGFAESMDGPFLEDAETYLQGAQIDVPQPEKGQVLIKVIRTNVNPANIHFIKGEYGLPRTAGTPVGGEAVGEVVAVGEGTGERAEALMGKRVTFFSSSSGAWAEYAIAEVASCIPVPDELRDEDAAALLVNPLSAIAMMDEVKKSGSKSFIMTAAGSQLCKLLTGLAVEEGIEAISIVRRDDYLERLKALGAASVLNSSDDDIKSALSAVIAEKKPRVLLDAVADQFSSEVFFGMPKGARWMIYGKLSPQLPILSQPGQFIFMDKQIEGFWLEKWMRTNDRQAVAGATMKAIEMFVSGKWRTDVRAEIKMADAIQQLPDAVGKLNTGKVMLVP